MNSLNVFFLAIHNILRWVVIGFGLVTIILIYNGWFRNKAWAGTITKISTFYTISLDIQLLVGLLLYFVFSSLTKALFADFGTAMSNPTLRFFGIEHVFMMVLAIVFAHIGNSTTKKDLPDKAKYKQAAIFFSISVLILFAGVPWASRPLLPAL